MAQEQNYEGWMDNIYRAVLNIAGGTFIDVGANLGQTLLKIISIDAQRDYLGFEPQILCCATIAQGIMNRQLDNCRILPIGLSNKNEVLELQTRGNHSTVASTVSGFRPDNFYDNKQLIYAAHGDGIIRELQLSRIACVKIDVEGAELEVMEGLEETFRSHIPFLVFEVLNHYLVVTQEELDDATKQFRNTRTKRMEALLRRCGYDIFNIVPDGSLREVEEIMSIVSSDLRITNYIAVHQDRREQYLAEFESLSNKNSEN